MICLNREHEWDKHGTCALGVPSINNQQDYFGVTLKLRENFDFTHILEKSKIVPGANSSYELDHITSSIKSVLTEEPIMSCYYHKETNTQYLAEMQLCLTKEFAVIDCGLQSKPKTLLEQMRSTSDQEVPCKSTIPVHYPIINKNFLNV